VVVEVTLFRPGRAIAVMAAADASTTASTMTRCLLLTVESHLSIR